MTAATAGGCGAAPGSEAAEGTAEEQERPVSAGEVLEETAPDGHPLRELPAAEAPSLELTAEPDSHDGWNIHLSTERFEFTPQESGSPASGGQGHAHLYIDGKKHARLYGPWFHLPADAVPEERHTLLVTLNADDHTTWAADAEAVQAEAELDGTEAAEPHDHAPRE